MWYVVRTEMYKEEETRDLLLGIDGVRDVYLPIYRKTIRSESGEERHHFVPTIGGFMFVRLDEDKVNTLVNSWGYLTYKTKAYDPMRKAYVEKGVVTSAHLLLCAKDTNDTPKEEIIAKARVSQLDIDRLRLFNDRLVEGMEDLRILDINFQRLAEEYDTVLITEGPYIGIEGVIKQVRDRGRKDRRLHFRIGNWTVCVPNIRSYRYVVIREARRGEKAREVSVWRNIDCLIGRLQAEIPGNASQLLRDILRSLNRDVRLDDYINSLSDPVLRRFLIGLTSEETGALISLSRYFQTYDRSIDTGLNELIPDLTLRPFLTPTAGKEIPEGQDYTTLLHDDFTEIILRVDLRPYFTLPAQSEAEDEDYIYYAHVAMIEETDGNKLAVIQWGEFIRQYLLKTMEEREAFHVDLASKGYTCLAALLTASQEKGSDIYLYNENGITGFARKIESDANLAPEARHEFPKTMHGFPETKQGFPQNHACFYPKASEDLPESKRGFGLDTACLSATRSMVSAIAPAAVEMWQGTRLLSWRKLAQRHVLLHKSPSDYPEDRPHHS